MKNPPKFSNSSWILSNTCSWRSLNSQRSLKDLLWLIVRRLADQPAVALVRIWLIEKGDICSTCLMKRECPDQTRCLHLVASAGHPASDPQNEWSRLDGDFRRFPLGVRKVGQIAETGQAIVIKEIEEGFSVDCPPQLGEGRKYSRVPWTADRVPG